MILKITEDYSEIRIDRYIKKQFNSISQSLIERLLRKKIILLNDKKAISSVKLCAGDIINFNYNFVANAKKHDTRLNNKAKYFIEKLIIYEDDNIIALNKPRGIATQGGSKVSFSLDAGVKSLNANYRIVHRLDKETSGLIIFAKSYKASKDIAKLFREKKIEKTYFAVVSGKPYRKNNIIDYKLKTSCVGGEEKIIVSDDGDVAITCFEVLSYDKTQNVSTLKVKIITGKKHQIRAHLSAIGCPVVGDKKYGSIVNMHMCLHSCQMICNYFPQISAEMPQYMKKFF